MIFSYDDIQKVAEPDHVLHIVAPYMPEGQRRQLFWGEFSEDKMVESYLEREKIVPPVHWRVTIGNEHRDGFWEGPIPERN